MPLNGYTLFSAGIFGATPFQTVAALNLIIVNNLYVIAQEASGRVR